MKPKKRQTRAEYVESLKERYGESILDDYDMVLSGKVNLTYISDKYEISGPYAGLIFKKLNGERSYTEFKKRGWVRDYRGKKVEYNPKGPSKSFIVTLPNEVHHRLKNYSTEIGVSMSSVVKDAIVSYLNKKIIRKYFPSTRK